MKKSDRGVTSKMMGREKENMSTERKNIEEKNAQK